MAILVIDQNAASRSAVALHLEDLRYSSIHAFDRFEAATEMLEDKARRHEAFNVEMVLVAVAPDDWSCLRAARSLQALHDVPVIVLAEPSPEAMKMAFALGAADFVGKPIDKFELLMRARGTLRWRLEYERRLARERELMEAIHQLAGGEKVKAGAPDHVDTLTGALSTTSFFTAVEREWKRAARGHRPMALVIVSVDDFARYRDAYGQRVADKCLQSVATVLKTVLRRPGDLVARFSEDSFAVLLPETPAEGARYVAETIQVCVADLRLTKVGSASAAAPGALTVSLNVLAAPAPDAGGLGDFLKNADWALAEARTHRDGKVHETQVGGRLLKAI